MESLLREWLSDGTPAAKERRRHLWAAMSLAIGAGFLVAGLWPFNFSPENAVHRVVPAGLRFGAHGQVYSALPWAATRPAPSPESAFSIEIWLQADRVCDCVGTILAFYNPSQEKDFRLEQSISDLAVRGYFRDEQRHLGFRSLWLDDSLAVGRATRCASVTCRVPSTSRR